MVQPGSSLTSFEQLDTAGNTIITAKGGAYSLWLERNIQHATLIQETGAAVKERFVAEKLTAMAGLRPALVNDKLRDEGYGVLDGHYAMVEQASGVPKAKGEEAFEWLREWIEEVKANGLVASLTKQSATPLSKPRWLSLGRKHQPKPRCVPCHQERTA